MREVLYRKWNSVKDRRKMMSIRETSDEQDCRTSVRKHFVYFVTQEKQMENTINPPRIDIAKYVNTRTNEEKFHFRVKGYFYITKNQQLLKVRFCHSLHIGIAWKKKIFSPKKSATLT